MKKTLRDIHAELFADYLIDGLKRVGIKQVELAKRSKLSPQMISQIKNKKPHHLTGRLILPERETVDKIAKAFGDPPALARRAAGYSENGRVETIEEALKPYLESKGLDEMGIEDLHPFLDMLNREIERRVKLPKNQRKGRKPIVDIENTDPEAETA